MESDGKSVDKQGRPAACGTGPIVFGEPGTNGQHAFYQLLHQGTKVIPCDFIIPARSQNPLGRHHPLASELPRPDRSADARQDRRVRAELVKRQGLSGEKLEKLIPQKVFTGNRPSNSSIVVDEMTRTPWGC